MCAYYKLRYSINDGIYGYARLPFSFFYVSSLSVLYPGKRSEKQHGQSFTDHAINSQTNSAGRHYRDLSKCSA